MAKDPTGNRSTPRVVKGASPSFDHSPTNISGGSSNTKVPTGNRPVPGVPRHHGTPAPKAGPVKAPIRHTRMATPKATANRALKGRAGGAKGNI